MNSNKSNQCENCKWYRVHYVIDYRRLRLAKLQEHHCACPVRRSFSVSPCVHYKENDPNLTQQEIQTRIEKKLSEISEYLQELILILSKPRANGE